MNTHWHKDTLQIQTGGKGLLEITAQVQQRIQGWQVQEGICFLFIQHTSASLIINENYDPSARKDLERFLEHLVPENQPWMRHTLEGADDSPSHMRTILTHHDLTIPVDDGRLNLGAWQGIYLFEHRARRENRRILIRALSIQPG